MKHTIRDVSVIVVTYRGDDLLRDCLSTLAAACGEDPQVVVVDNSPDEGEGTRALVAQYPNAVYVPSPGNPGFAGGNNRALAHCTRDYILLLNNDTLVRARASIARLVAFLDENPRCAVAQGTMVVPDGLLGGCGSFLTPFGFLYAAGSCVPDAPRFRRAYPCFSAIGAFMMLRRTVIAEAGNLLFRTRFWSYYEETDFCHRVWLAGREVWYVPTPPIVHLWGRTAGRFARAAVMGRYLRNQLFSLSANLGWWGRLWLVPSLMCVIAALALVRLAQGEAALFRAHIEALAAHFGDRARILAARRQVARMRRVGDGAIFRQVMRLPPLAYVLRSARR